jgi:abhydrolase domain-containing protein 6
MAVEMEPCPRTYSAAEWRRRDVVLPHAGRIAVFESGRSDPDARTIVFVHGLGHWTQAAWDALSPELSGEYRLLAFDLPGFGESDKPDARYDAEFFTATLAQLVRRLGAERFALIGNSLGGLIAASYAGTEPERVAMLGLIDPAGFRITRRLLMNALFCRPAAWLVRGRPPLRFVRGLYERAVLDPSIVPEHVYERAVALARDPGTVRAFVRIYSNVLTMRLDRMRARYARYRGPVELFWGRRDPYVPVSALADAQRVYPQANATVFDECAHLPNVEFPREVAQRLKAAFPPW